VHPIEQSVATLGPRDAARCTVGAHGGIAALPARAGWSMIPKSGYRFSENIMLKQKAGAG
jgi:hypothetical protein